MNAMPSTDTDTLPQAAADRPQPTRDIEQGKRDLDRYGYAIHEDLIDRAALAALRARLEEQAEMECAQGVATYRMAGAGEIGDRKLGSPPADQTPVWQAVLALPNKGREFIDLAMNAIVADYARHIFTGVPCYLAQSTGLIVRKGSGGQVLHSDQLPVPFQTPLPVYINIMLAISDFEAGMGVTELVPGSHRLPAPRLAFDTASGKARSLETAKPLPVECKAGSAVVFDSRLWHNQGSSTSDKTRLSILNGYCMHFIRAQDDYVASIHDDVLADLSAEEQRMLGFEVVSEYTGRVFPRFAGDTRRNLNVRSPYIPALRRGGEARALPFAGMGTDES